MTDLVDRLLFAPAGVEPVGEIQDESIVSSDIAISVHHSRRNKSQDRIVLPYHEGGFQFGLAGSVFPKYELELAG